MGHRYHIYDKLPLVKVSSGVYNPIEQFKQKRAQRPKTRVQPGQPVLKATGVDAPEPEETARTKGPLTVETGISGAEGAFASLF